jgi:hypothetical protein
MFSVCLCSFSFHCVKNLHTHSLANKLTHKILCERIFVNVNVCTKLEEMEKSEWVCMNIKIEWYGKWVRFVCVCDRNILISNIFILMLSSYVNMGQHNKIKWKFVIFRANVRYHSQRTHSPVCAK